MAGKPSTSPVLPRGGVARDVGEGGDVDGGGRRRSWRGERRLERFLDDDIVGEIVIDQGCWRIWRSAEGVRDLVGLASDMPDVTGELADKQDSLSSSTILDKCKPKTFAQTMINKLFIYVEIRFFTYEYLS